MIYQPMSLIDELTISLPADSSIEYCALQSKIGSPLQLAG
jgi:hypothetical protein